MSNATPAHIHEDHILHTFTSVGYTIRVAFLPEQNIFATVMPGGSAIYHRTQSEAICQAANLVLADVAAETGSAIESLEVK